MYTELGLFIGGKWANGKGRKAEAVINPANEKTLAELPRASKADLDEALEAAKKGFEVWRKTDSWARGRVMGKAADIIRAAQGVDKKLITDVTLFDVYDGKGIPEGKKSVAIAVTLQPREKTLTDQDIEAVATKIVADVTKKTGSTLRE